FHDLDSPRLILGAPTGEPPYRSAYPARGRYARGAGRRGLAVCSRLVSRGPRARIIIAARVETPARRGDEGRAVGDAAGRDDRAGRRRLQAVPVAAVPPARCMGARGEDGADDQRGRGAAEKGFGQGSHDLFSAKDTVPCDRDHWARWTVSGPGKLPGT